MDKRQFAEEVIANVRSLSVSSVLSTRMDLVYRYGVYKGLCPFHNDGKLGSFIVTDTKGIWKCFACGAGGDTVKFGALFDGINYLESAFKLALEFGLISRSEYEEYFERKRYSRDVIIKMERKYVEMDKKKIENEIADNYVLDKVFRLFIYHCSLSEEHKNYLMTERQLTQEEIKEGMYFTFPTGQARRQVVKDFFQSLQQFKDQEMILSKVPGFYFDKKQNRFTFAKHQGIGIGIKNAKGQVVGIQIRHDKKDEEKSRYIWFSSSFASYDDKKFEYGTSSGSPIDVVYPKKITNQYVYITEGRFKAQKIASKMGSIAISVQGVGSWRGIVKQLDMIPEIPIVNERLDEKLSEKLNGKPFYFKGVLSAFDADMNYKVQVFEQLRKMTDALENVENYKYPVYYLNWDESLGKGIDDIFINGHESAIKRYDKQKWDKHYENMIQDILEEEQFLEIKNVPLDVIQKYFLKHFENFSPLAKGEISKKHQKKRDELIRLLQS